MLDKVKLFPTFLLFAYFLFSAIPLWANQFTIIDPAQWRILGTVSEYQNTLEEHWLVIGDELGNDPSDSDQDENLWNSIAARAFSPHDYDALVARVPVRPPVTLYFHGYLSTTRSGFHEAGLAYENPAFTGELNGELPIGARLAYFALNYRSPDVLQTVVHTDSGETPAPVKLYGQDDRVDQDGLVWGEFEISWDGHEVVFKRNGQVVRTEPLEYEAGKGVVAYFRNYDHPFEFEMITFEGESLEEEPAGESGASGDTEESPGEEGPTTSSQETGPWRVREILEDLCAEGWPYFLTEGTYLCVSGRDIYLRNLEGEELAAHIGDSTHGPINNIARTSQGTLYAFGGSDIDYGTSMVLLRSTDGGYHWELLNENIRELTEGNVALGYGQAFHDPASGEDILYARTGIVYNGGILKSYDSGRTWQKIWDPSQIEPCREVVLRMLFASATNGVAVVSHTEMEEGRCIWRKINPDVYLTEDGGATWRKLFGLQDLAAQLYVDGTLYDDTISVYEIVWTGERGYLRIDGNPKDFIVAFDRSGAYQLLPLFGQPRETVTISDLYYSSAHGLFIIANRKVYALSGNSWEEVFGEEPVDYFVPLFLNEFPPRLKRAYGDVYVMELVQQTGPETPSPEPVPTRKEVGMADPESAPVSLSGPYLNVDFNYQAPVDILMGIFSCDFSQAYYLDPRGCELSSGFNLLSREEELHCQGVSLPITNGYLFWLVSPVEIGSLDFGNGAYLLQFLPVGSCL